MQKNEQITRIGRKTYLSGGAKTYDYAFRSDIAREINDAVNDFFSPIRIVVWESIQLNNWLNLLLSKNTIFVEIQSGFEFIVFNKLMDMFGNMYTLLLNPDEEMIARYMRNELIIAKTLFSRSPVSKNKRNIKLEKLAVDVIADKYLSGLLGASGVEDVILGIKHNYTIDVSKMFTYAKRRNKEKELIDIWESDND